MTITLRDAPARRVRSRRCSGAVRGAALRRLRRGLDFAAGKSAVVLRHVAYGHDFVHDGRCLATARELLFAEPGYDCAALGRDPERRRVLDAGPGAGWAAVLLHTAHGPGRPVQLVDGRPVHARCAGGPCSSTGTATAGWRASSGRMTCWTSRVGPSCPRPAPASSACWAPPPRAKREGRSPGPGPP